MLTVDLYLGTGNHGCSDAVVVAFAGPYSRVGTVVEERSCTSCWQVGHDAAHPLARVGGRIRLRVPAVRWAAHVGAVEDRGRGLLAEDWPAVCGWRWDGQSEGNAWAGRCYGPSAA